MPPINTAAAPRSTPRARFTSSLINQLSIGPAFREVAAYLLRLQLRERYPTLDIDPDIVMVGTPSWQIIDGEIVALPPRYQALADILAQQAVLAVPALFIEGIHFLTRLPIAEPAVHLPVRIADMSLIINVLAPVMIRGYQQRQLEFWDETLGDAGPHWHELGVVLRNLWNTGKTRDWTDEDGLMARQVVLAPELADRALNDRFETHAYVLDVDQVDDEGQTTHLNEHLVSVIIGKQKGQEVILAHSMLLGFRKYATLNALGEDLPLLLDTAITHKNIQWRLLEPDGDFFDYLACTLVTIQIEAIGAINFSDLRGEGASQLSLAGPPGAAPLGKRPDQDLAWLQQALPDWLADASISDMNIYSRHMKNLSALQNFYQGKTYNDGLAPIEQYAANRLMEEILTDHPDAADLSLDTLQMRVQSPVAWGLFPVPGQFDISVYSVTQLALQNLISVPLGIKSLRQKAPYVLPEWLTVDYLEKLITRIDIGKTYPQLIKSTLLGDPQETDRRRMLYSNHLAIQLPLLALQGKIRGENGLDELGYRFVSAAMHHETVDRQVDGMGIVVRPLAFVPSLRLDQTPDIVANMFVIGPQDPTAGPCLLYRPLLDTPLSQYPSPANLVYAIQQSPSLRESVLAWLPDNVRNDYSHYVLPSTIPSPWAVAEAVTNPLKLASLCGPLKLGANVISADLFSTLYEANANALITLADRQSVSNAEARWATLKNAGWAIFNGVLPFLWRAVGAAAWIWQIMDQLQALTDAAEHPVQHSPWAALSDLLLNLGMAIALHAAARNAPRSTSEAEPASEQPESPLPTPSVEPTVIRQLPTLNPTELPYEHPRPLHTSGALNRTPARLAVVLDSFKIDKPQALGVPISTEGPHRYLYQVGQKYYAQVGNRWFEVQVDENDSAVIVDSARPQRTGPPLIHNKQGHWFVDPRLRLRGGGPKAMIQRSVSLATQRAEQLHRQLSDFEQTKKTLQAQLKTARDAMEAGPSTSSHTAAETSRTTYLRTLKNQCRQYESALQLLKQLTVHAYTPDYSRRALGILTAQTEMTLAGIDESNTRFKPKMSEVLAKITRQANNPQERYINEARQMTVLNTEMLKHLDYIETRLVELQQLGEDGAHLRRDTQHVLPRFKSTDIRTLQVTMARNLCLAENTTATAPQAWNTIDQIVDAADLAILGLRDTLYERSEARLDERIDLLSNLSEQFQVLDERLEDFSTQFSEHVRGENIQTLRGQLRVFQRDAARNLSQLSTEREGVRSRGTPPPVVPPVQRKIIRTLHDGLLIGEPRLDEGRRETGFVDITSPLTEKVVATYHEKDGVWLRHWETAPILPVLELFGAASEGQELLNELPAFLERAERHANTAQRTPSGIEYLFHQHAQVLENARSAITRARLKGNPSQVDIRSANTVENALKTAVKDLYQRSENHMLKLFKASSPTVSGVEWLKRHGAITIKKIKFREALTKGPKPLFLDEYVIRDRQTQDILWYAQFHYSESWTTPDRYLSGRLKTVDEYHAGSDTDSINITNELQRIAYLRSDISVQPATELFFDAPKQKRRVFQNRQ